MERLAGTDVLTVIRARVAELERENERLKEANGRLLALAEKRKRSADKWQHRANRYRRMVGVRSWERRRCASCGTDLDLVTAGCNACRVRHYHRRKAGLKVAA